MAGWVTNSTKSDNFVTFLGDLVAQTPPQLDLHCIADNFTAHKTSKVAKVLRGEPSGAHPSHAYPRQLAEPSRVVSSSILEHLGIASW